MSGDDRVVQPTAALPQRVEAIQAALDARGINTTEAVKELEHLAQDEWVPRAG
jgi:nitrile hydratase